MPNSSSSETPTLLSVLMPVLVAAPEMSHFHLALFPCSSELESDFNGDSSNSEVSEGQTSLLEPPACPSPIQRWASLIRSPVVPEETSKTSKVADGKQYPDLGVLQQPLLRQAGLGERFQSGGFSLQCGQLVPVNGVFWGGSAFLVL